MRENVACNYLSIVLRSLALALAGWLAYGLLRALWTVFYLGTPAYDWSWYLAITVLLPGLLVWLAWGRPHQRHALALFIPLLAWAIIGYTGLGQVIYLYPGQAPPARLSFWTPPIDWRQTPDSTLRDLQAAGGRVYLWPAVNPIQAEQGATLAEGLRRLAEYDIEVYLVPHSSNFLSVPIHREWMASARDAAAFARREKLGNVRGLAGDVEQPMHTRPDIVAAERANFDQSVVDLRQFIDEMHCEYPELRIGITAVWLHYVDGLDGDTDLSMILRSPADPPAEWDYVNVMVYSSYFPPAWRAYYVYLIERAMARRYQEGSATSLCSTSYPGNRVSYLIGLVGGGFPGEAVLTFDQLVRDARLSRALGVCEIVVFQLQGALRAFGDDFVGRLTTAVNDVSPSTRLEIPFSRPASLMLYGIALLDALLDVRGQWGWLWLGWLVLSGLIASYSVLTNRGKSRLS
jgi:hypothetical protein